MDTATEERQHREHDQENGSGLRSYLRFVAMVATATVIMYGLTYVNTHAIAHVRFSETRLYMSLLMGGVMAIVMLLYMLNMYRSVMGNMAIIGVSVLLFALGTWLVRSQTLVQDRSYMSAMIPHHSIAILTSENSQISDQRVCELAVKIIEAQRREIAEMEWLIEDIERNGEVTTAEDAAERPVPEFVGTSERECATT